jgi:hypothetical protein
MTYHDLLSLPEGSYLLTPGDFRVDVVKDKYYINGELLTDKEVYEISSYEEDNVSNYTPLE